MTLLADVALAVTVVLALGALAGMALRRSSPALRHGVLRATLVGVWVAPLLVAVASLTLVARPGIAVAVPHYERTVALVAATEASPPTAAGGPAMPINGGSVPVSQRARMSATPALLGLWGLGVLLGLGVLARDTVALRRLLAKARAAGGDEAGIAALAERLGLSRLPRAVVSSEVTAPAVAQWLPPTLVLPGDGGVAAAALIHELAHLQRGDVAALMAGRLSAIVWWWHPLAWLLLRELAATAEEAADDCVLALTDDPRDYARLLTDWAGAVAAAGCVNCNGRGRALVARVRRVLDERVRPVLDLSWRARVALILGGVAVVLAGAAVHVRAGDGPTQKQVPPAAEALQADRPELSLEMYLAERVDETGAVDVSEGQRLFEYETDYGTTRRFLAEAEPVFTEEDIARVEPVLGMDPQEGRPLRETDTVSFRMKDKEAFLEWTGDHVGDVILWVLDGEVVMAPSIRSAIPGVGIWMGLTPEQTEALLGYFGWGEPPEPIPGMGTIRVSAHFADGSRPMPAVCDARLRDADSIQHSRDASERTVTVGADGDWTVHNAEPGLWTVSTRGPSFAEPPGQSVEVSAGATANVDLEVGPGGTITGRVVVADTGEPVDQARVVWRLRDQSAGGGAVTDRSGSYELRRVLPGTGSVWAYVRERYVSRETGEFEVREEETVEAPELRLLRGGTIRASIAMPPDVPEPGEQRLVWQFIEALPLFALPEGVTAMRGGAPLHEAIETEPLPPGRYRVKAVVAVGMSYVDPDLTWSGEAGPVEVQVGEATDVGLIEVTRDQE